MQGNPLLLTPLNLRTLEASKMSHAANMQASNEPAVRGRI